MPANRVSLVRYKGIDSIREAVHLGGGFEAIGSGARVLIKPNLVGWDNQGPYPPWGVLTTSLVMEGLCAAMKDAGATEIRIGEGSIQCKAIGSGTREIYTRLGYDKLVKKYGVILSDFNEEAFEERELDPGHIVKVTRLIRECDHVVNVPVLKTHSGTVVTLGMKNLKGLLHGSSKGYCHHPDNLLDHFIVRLAETFPSTLTLIDGIYANERGPLHMGHAHRFNTLLASTDMYAADLLGAHLLGYGNGEVKYLREWAERHARSASIDDLEICGDVPPEEVRKPLSWDWEWLPDNSAPYAFSKMGIKGVRLPKYEHTLCTGCSYMFNPLMILLLSVPKRKYDNVEFLTGSIQKPSGAANKTFLFGRCQIQQNKDHRDTRETVPIKGCPPSMEEIETVLQKHGIAVNRKGYEKYRRDLMRRYESKPDVYPLTDFYMGEIPADALPPP